MNNSLDKLRTIEIDILSIGDKIADLFDKIQDIYGGKSYDDTNDNTLNLEDVLKSISTTRENLHKEVEELYNVNNYPYKNKVSNEINEKDKQEKQILEIFYELATK